MAIPRRISFLEESRSRGMAKKMKSIPRGPRGISRNDLSQKSLKNLKIPPKFQKKLEKKNEKKFEHGIYTSKFEIYGNITEN